MINGTPYSGTVCLAHYGSADSTGNTVAISNNFFNQAKEQLVTEWLSLLSSHNSGAAENATFIMPKSPKTGTCDTMLSQVVCKGDSGGNNNIFTNIFPYNTAGTSNYQYNRITYDVCLIGSLVPMSRACVAFAIANAVNINFTAQGTSQWTVGTTLAKYISLLPTGGASNAYLSRLINATSAPDSAFSQQAAAARAKALDRKPVMIAGVAYDSREGSDADWSENALHKLASSVAGSVQVIGRTAAGTFCSAYGGPVAGEACSQVADAAIESLRSWLGIGSHEAKVPPKSFLKAVKA